MPLTLVFATPCRVAREVMRTDLIIVPQRTTYGALAELLLDPARIKAKYPLVDDQNNMSLLGAVYVIGVRCAHL